MNEADSVASRFSYNSVGALGIQNLLQNKPELSPILQRASWLSVRDYRSHAGLISHDVEAHLVPDSALIMRSLFSEELKDQLHLKQHLPSRYIVVQFNEAKGPDDHKRFAQDLLKISSDLEADIVLLPIGLARGHNDQRALRDFNKLIPTAHFHMPKTIFDIMKTIAGSELFVGTSLHGVITAQAFRRPFVALTKYITKTHFYLETWDKHALSCVEYADFYNDSQTALRYRYDEESEIEMEGLVWASLRQQLS